MTPWQCQVSLRFEFENDNRRRREKVEERVFGNPIRDGRDVELAIRRAQTAILNPWISSERFLECSESDICDRKTFEGKKPALQFSKNVVCLDITGPEVVNLAFVDLPGKSFH
jgi:hypothetical protein